MKQFYKQRNATTCGLFLAAFKCRNIRYAATVLRRYAAEWLKQTWSAGPRTFICPANGKIQRKIKTGLIQKMWRSQSSGTEGRGTSAFSGKKSPPIKPGCHIVLRTFAVFSPIDVTPLPISQRFRANSTTPVAARLGRPAPVPTPSNPPPRGYANAAACHYLEYRKIKSEFLTSVLE